MPSKLHHITRRRKNALVLVLKQIERKNKKTAAIVAISGESSVIRSSNLENQADVLRHRIASGAHSTAWYKKQARKKPVAAEIEAA